MKKLLMNSTLIAQLPGAILTYFALSEFIALDLAYGYLALMGLFYISYKILPHIGPMWVVHFTDDVHVSSILDNGFRRPTTELEAIKAGIPVTTLGQSGLDVVSSYSVYTKPVVNMRKSLSRGNIVPIYLYVPVERAFGSQLTTSFFGIHTSHGYTIESLSSRTAVNTAIETIQYRLTRPDEFYSWRHIVLLLSAMWSRLTLQFLVDAIKSKRSIIV